MYNQSPTFTLQCVPQINTGVTGIGGTTLVYQVSGSFLYFLNLKKNV